MTHLQEMEFEAIQPTRTYRDEERSARMGGVDTQVVEQILYTVYSVEKIIIIIIIIIIITIIIRLWSRFPTLCTTWRRSPPG